MVCNMLQMILEPVIFLIVLHYHLSRLGLHEGDIPGFWPFRQGSFNFAVIQKKGGLCHMLKDVRRVVLLGLTKVNGLYYQVSPRWI